jgi:predicted RNA-binding Zn-ribbon protein involved in translation (DUF1610 family)
MFMKQCSNCQTELSIEKNAVFVVCPKCKILLYIDKNGIDPVDRNKIDEKHQQVNGLVRWVCVSILDHHHQWSDKGYVLSDDDHCIILSVCKRCFSTWTNTNNRHAFIEDYIHDDSCEKRRVCTKCGKIVISKDPEHVFTLHDYYFKEGTCEEERKCAHCGLVEKRGTKHAFHDSDWVLLDRTDCKNTRACRRCGQVEEAIRHSGEWVVLEMKYLTPNGESLFFREKRICDVCGFEEIREGVESSAYHN